ncbi:putative beta-glucosidase 23 [Zea mays]|jgi:beta-glucosidase|uniref:Putative beta-glucosidase 23 n=1 Tax=Zea mays TaxID=4577 RepID=A0A3L6FU67_MAIZE|nr:putative beta-glucosidase 23 [Zea mays]
MAAARRGLAGALVKCWKRYFVWSFLDVFELLAGYYSRYDLYHVDFQDPELPRMPKLSALWYGEFLKNEIDIIENVVVSATDNARWHAAGEACW